MKFSILFLSILFSISVIAQEYYDVDWQYSGQITTEAFGWAMSEVGDVNGDGYTDLLISAIDHSDPIETEEEEGKIYLFYGGPDGISEEPVWSYEPNETLYILGFDVGGGDINGDGFSDIAVGCLQWTGDQAEEGKVIVFYGSSDGLGDSPDWTAEGNQDYSLMGSSVALSGDINSDGYNDLFISAKMYDSGEVDEGKVWLYYGSSDGPVESGWSWESNQANAIGGFPVRYAGDVNNDGFDDVIIGANNHSSFFVEDGLAVAFYGSIDGLSLTPNWQATGGETKSAFGHWVDGAGDVNGDGYDDVIVSAILHDSDTADFNEGWVFAFYGSASGLSSTYSWVSEGDLIQGQYGYSIAGAGDLNNDGYSDIIIGAKYWVENYEGEGAAFIFFGSPTGLENVSCWKKFGGQNFGYLGKTVAGGNADYNNDGFDDFLVSAYRFTNIYPADGIAYGIYGKYRESDFQYDSDTYCFNNVDPIPDILGLTGGVYSASSGLVFSDVESGAIDLSESSLGIHQIYYTYEGEFCPASSVREINIIAPSVNGMFAYPNDTINIASPNPIPYIFPDASAGTFSSIPSGLTFTDIFSGEIDLTSSVPGTYLISNALNDPSCGPVEFYFTITISPTCYKPDAPTVTDITETSATVTWNSIDYATTYDLYLTRILDTTIYTGLTETTYNFTELFSGSLYKTWIIAKCDYKVSPKSDKTNFNTGGTSIENHTTGENNFEIFPQPANSTLYIKSETIGFNSIIVTDLTGQKLQEINLQNLAPEYALNTKNWSPGMYMIIITGTNTQELKPCIILH